MLIAAFYARTATTGTAPGKVALERAAYPHAGGRAGIYRFGRLLLLYPQRPAVLVPTFVGAYAGSDEHLPARQMAFADPSARDAKHLMVRLLREKAAYEANVFPENNFIVSASVFPYFYGLVGDRNPRQAPKAAHARNILRWRSTPFRSSRKRARSPNTGFASYWAATSPPQPWTARWMNCGPSYALPAWTTPRRKACSGTYSSAGHPRRLKRACTSRWQSR